MLVACGGGQPAATSVAPPVIPMEVEPTVAAAATPGPISMGGAALGGNAQTTVLAQLNLNDVPAGPLAWVTHSLELGDGQEIIHRHQTAFVYAAKGAHDLIVGGGAERLAEGQGFALEAEIEHRLHNRR